MPVETHIATVGDIKIGGSYPIVVQSMTNTSTLDTISTVRQIESLTKAGCQMVRITAQNIKEAKNLHLIKKELKSRGIKVPIIADIHYIPEVARIAASIVEKIRINPGNYISGKNNSASGSDDLLEKAAEKLHPLLQICKENGTAIRVGTNHGSLSQRILYKYGNTPEGMVFSALEFIDILRENNFHNIVVSVKSSDVFTMIKANRLLVTEMKTRGYFYPVHLGVTEAGAGQMARIKSAAGIGSLLASGIGDTIRVSLTENPLEEIPFAKKIARTFPKGKKYILKHDFYTIENNNVNHRTPIVIATGQSSNADFSYVNNKFIDGTGLELKLKKSKSLRENLIIKLKNNHTDFDNFLIKTSVDTTLVAEKKKIAGIWIDNENKTNDEQNTVIALDILQALKLRFSKTEFIACPSCGRTRFDIMKQLKKVENALPNLKNVKIAIMGCIVNGLGEMEGADYGYVGSGTGKVTIFKGKKAVYKNISEDIALEKLIDLIKSEEHIA
jgi:(E)-4-hydroxy-3-methylbut-2-enyl-diphosphate synthase